MAWKSYKRNPDGSITYSMRDVSYHEKEGESGWVPYSPSSKASGPSKSSRGSTPSTSGLSSSSSTRIERKEEKKRKKAVSGPSEPFYTLPDGTKVPASKATPKQKAEAVAYMMQRSGYSKEAVQKSASAVYYSAGGKGEYKYGEGQKSKKSQGEKSKIQEKLAGIKNKAKEMTGYLKENVRQAMAKALGMHPAEYEISQELYSAPGHYGISKEKADELMASLRRQLIRSKSLQESGPVIEAMGKLVEARGMSIQNEADVVSASMPRPPSSQSSREIDEYNRRVKEYNAEVSKLQKEASAYEKMAKEYERYAKWYSSSAEQYNKATREKVEKERKMWEAYKKGEIDTEQMIKAGLIEVPGKFGERVLLGTQIISEKVDLGRYWNKAKSQLKLPSGKTNAGPNVIVPNSATVKMVSSLFKPALRKDMPLGFMAREIPKVSMSFAGGVAGGALVALPSMVGFAARTVESGGTNIPEDIMSMGEQAVNRPAYFAGTMVGSMLIGKAITKGAGWVAGRVKVPKMKFLPKLPKLTIVKGAEVDHGWGSYVSREGQIERYMSVDKRLGMTRYYRAGEKGITPLERRPVGELPDVLKRVKGVQVQKGNGLLTQNWELSKIRMADIKKAKTANVIVKPVYEEIIGSDVKALSKPLIRFGKYQLNIHYGEISASKTVGGLPKSKLYGVSLSRIEETVPVLKGGKAYMEPAVKSRFFGLGISKTPSGKQITIYDVMKTSKPFKLVESTKKFGKRYRGKHTPFPYNPPTLNEFGPISLVSGESITKHLLPLPKISPLGDVTTKVLPGSISRAMASTGIPKTLPHPGLASIGQAAPSETSVFLPYFHSGRFGSAISIPHGGRIERIKRFNITVPILPVKGKERYKSRTKSSGKEGVRRLVEPFNIFTYGTRNVGGTKPTQSGTPKQPQVVIKKVKPKQVQKQKIETIQGIDIGFVNPVPPPPPPPEIKSIPLLFGKKVTYIKPQVMRKVRFVRRPSRKYVRVGLAPIWEVFGYESKTGKEAVHLWTPRTVREWNIQMKKNVFNFGVPLYVPAKPKPKTTRKVRKSKKVKRSKTKKRRVRK